MSFNEILRSERISDGTKIILGLPTDEDGNPTTEREKTVAVSRDVLKEGHIHVRGRTRSGKTSLAIAPLLQQLIQPYAYRCPDGTIIEQMRDPVFIFDLGGDLSLFNFVKQELCEQPKQNEQGDLQDERKFRFLSLKKNDDWDYFDPFQIVPDGEKDVIRLSQILIEAFNQNYGLLYGASYYTMRSLSALTRVANRVIQRNRNGESPDFRQVGEALLKQKGPDVRDEAQIRMAFQFLMTYEQLQRPPKEFNHRQIRMSSALENSEVVYFFCPSMGQATTARQVAGLGLYTLLAAAQLRKDSGKNGGAGHRHAWVVVDEFHELAGRSFASLLAQSSKYGISLILANQTTTQLETRDVNLAHVVRDNTLAKIYFTITGKTDFEDLQGFSLEATQELKGQNVREDDGLIRSISLSTVERLSTQLHRDTILKTSAKSNNFFFVLDDGNGHKEPQPLFTDYAVGLQDFTRFKNTPVPQKSTKMLRLLAANLSDRDFDGLGSDAVKNDYSAKLLDLWLEKQRQERPGDVKRYYLRGEE